MEPGRTASIDVRLLGPIALADDGRDVPLGGPRQRALLALLSIRPGQVVSAATLVEELWPGESPDGAATTLRSYVSRLRSSLAGAASVTSSDRGYAVDVPPEAVDAVRFERLVREGDAALGRGAARQATERLTQALELWRGRAFGELVTGPSLRVDAERLEERRLHALERRIEADLTVGLAAELVDEIEALVQEHPFRERLWEHLMLALYRAGRQADALAAYHRARGALDEQLGIEPGEELQALEGAILRHEVAAASTPEERHNLPVSLTSFVGREAALADIARLLAESRLVSLTGVGGVGKTRLAIEAARSATGEFADGVCFVDLAPLADPSLVPSQVGAALGIREQPGVPATRRLSTHLRSLEILIVLDNCEHLRVAAADLARQLLQSCPRLRVLATSREALGVPGEVDYAVSSLSLPAVDDPRVERDSEAVRLFVARARDARPGLPDDDATIATIARICLDLDGLPLGIELAAARARALSASEIADRLRDRFQFLVSWRRLTSARHRTLREAMDWSYDLLGEEEQRVLAELSVFSGGFSLDSVAGVCSGPAEHRALELVERLVDASLVIVDHAVAPTRYRLLETVRQYGAQRLDAAGRAEELRRRHAAYFTTFAEAAWGPLRNLGVQTTWLDLVAQERDNLRAALVWLHDTGESDGVIRIAEAIWWFWWIRGELTEGRSWLDLAVRSALDSDPALRARALLGAAGLAWAQADYAMAMEHAEAALVLFRQLGDHIQAGSALNTLGLGAHGRRDNVASRELFEAAIREYRSLGVDPALAQRNIAVAIDNLGSVAHEVGEDDRARAHYEDARAINLGRGDEEGVAMGNLHLGLIAAEGERIGEARDLLGSALGVYRSLGFVQYVAECLEAASVVANRLDDAREAAILLGASSRMREDAGSPPVPFMARLRDRETELARARLGDARAREALTEGERLGAEAAMERALAFLGT